MALKVDDDIEVLREFLKIYCESKHRDREKTTKDNITLCDECHDTLIYSAMRRKYCPQDPKPTCKKCEIHCYKPKYRIKIKEIMRYSGKKLIKQGRLDLIFHYLF